MITILGCVPTFNSDRFLFHSSNDNDKPSTWCTSIIHGFMLLICVVDDEDPVHCHGFEWSPYGRENTPHSNSTEWYFISWECMTVYYIIADVYSTCTCTCTRTRREYPRIATNMFCAEHVSIAMITDDAFLNVCSISSHPSFLPCISRELRQLYRMSVQFDDSG